MFNKIMIPVAAFAVTVTGASAFSGDLLQKLDLNLTTEQISTLEEVHELRQDGGDREQIKAMLDNAGLDKEKMNEIKEAAHGYQEEQRTAIHEAIANEDFAAYQAAVVNSPRADLIDSEANFQKLIEAQQLRASGDHEGAREIMSELGFEKPAGHGFGKGEGRGFGGPDHRGDRQSAETE